jgi:hypothetical protein
VYDVNDCVKDDCDDIARFRSLCTVSCMCRMFRSKCLTPESRSLVVVQLYNSVFSMCRPLENK